MAHFPVWMCFVVFAAATTAPIIAGALAAHFTVSMCFVPLVAAVVAVAVAVYGALHDN